MARRSSTHTQMHGPVPNRLGVLEFELSVAGADKGVSTPDRLLTALRSELLGTLDATLESLGAGRDEIFIDSLAIDLGPFPEPIDWGAVRKRFRQSLESAISPYLTLPRTKSTAPGAAISNAWPEPKLGKSNGTRGEINKASARALRRVILP